MSFVCMLMRGEGFDVLVVTDAWDAWRDVLGVTCVGGGDVEACGAYNGWGGVASCGTVEPGLLVGGVGDKKRVSRSGGWGNALILRD